MKKLIIASLIILATAGSAFATAVTVAMAPPKGFTPSNNVGFGYISAANTVGVNDRYTIGTKHTSGDKIFGTTSASGTIYYTTGVPGTALVTGNIGAVPATSTDSSMPTIAAGAWTAM
jgi:hypothetical protein